MAHAAGGVSADPSATAALEAAAGAYARAFAVAEVTPATPATRALSPAVLALMARDLIRRGEFCHVIDVDRDGARLTPAGSPMGRARSHGPRDVALSRSAGRSLRQHHPQPAGCRGGAWSILDRPGAAVGRGVPLAWASLTGKLHANLEDAIADEAGGTRGHLLPVPQGPDGDELDPDTGEPVDPLADLRADVASLRGKTVLTETTAAGWGEGSLAAPRADWKPQRIGADPPASLATLRTDSAQAVLAACGVSADLFTHGDAAGQRESWRRSCMAAFNPWAICWPASWPTSSTFPDCDSISTGCSLRTCPGGRGRSSP